jgi:hypothetical protein
MNPMDYQRYSNDLIVGIFDLPQYAADLFASILSRLDVPLDGEYECQNENIEAVSQFLT